MRGCIDDIYGRVYAPAMKLQRVVKDLIETGLTEGELATKAGVTQPTINRIRTGETRNPGFALGTALLALHKERVKPTKPKDANP